MKRILRTIPKAQWTPKTKQKGSPTLTTQPYYESTLKMNDYKFSKLIDIYGEQHDKNSISYRPVFRATKPQFSENLKKNYPIKIPGKNHLQTIQKLREKFLDKEVDVYDGKRFEEIVGLANDQKHNICVLDYKFLPGKMVPNRMRMIETTMLPSGDFATQEQNTTTMTALAQALGIPEEDFYVTTDTLIIKKEHRSKIKPEYPLQLESTSKNTLVINGFQYNLEDRTYIYVRVKRKTLRDCLRLATLNKLCKSDPLIMKSAAHFYHDTRSHLLNRLERPPVLTDYREFSHFLSDTAKYAHSLLNIDDFFEQAG